MIIKYLSHGDRKIRILVRNSADDLSSGNAESAAKYDVKWRSRPSGVSVSL